MRRHIPFGSIPQFRKVIKDIKHTYQYVGQNEDDEPIYDKSAILPIVTATGYEKIHGTNAAVCFSKADGMWVQSKSNIITLEKDNAACAFNAYANEEHWTKIAFHLINYHGIDLNKKIVTIFFEWSGGNIQKLSAVTGLEKMAFIFPYFKVVDIKQIQDDIGAVVNTGTQWLSTNNAHNSSKNIWNITTFKTFPITINFNEALLSQNQMIKTIEEDIEPNSPVGKKMGIEGNIGEGLVYCFEHNNTIHSFKVKGEKHSKSKVKTLKPVDDVKEKSKIDFANYACTPDRLEQAWQKTFGIGNEIQKPTISATGTFLRYVINDVHKEETDILIEAGLLPKDVNSNISTIARRWFMTELGDLV